MEALAGEIRGTVAAIDPSMAVAQIRSMESILADALGAGFTGGPIRVQDSE